MDRMDRDELEERIGISWMNKVLYDEWIVLNSMYE